MPRGPSPKPPALRQRVNKATTRTKLASPEEAAEREVPGLPPRELATENWHPRVLAWWESVWKSPMAGEFLGPDVLGGLHALAEAYQKLWSAQTPAAFISVLSEIRLQEVRFGLSPIDRRRLQWEVEKGELAADKTAKRRKKKATTQAKKKDPREVLKVV